MVKSKYYLLILILIVSGIQLSSANSCDNLNFFIKDIGYTGYSLNRGIMGIQIERVGENNPIKDLEVKIKIKENGQTNQYHTFLDYSDEIPSENEEGVFFFNVDERPYKVSITPSISIGEGYVICDEITFDNIQDIDIPHVSRIYNLILIDPEILQAEEDSKKQMEELQKQIEDRAEEQIVEIINKNITSSIQSNLTTEDDNIEQKCNGCLFEEVCLSIGYRKDSIYCGINKTFVEQKTEDEKCDNSFECQSNVCVNNQCISGSFLQKILGWFRKIFG